MTQLQLKSNYFLIRKTWNSGLLTFFTTKEYSVHGLEICILFIAPLITGRIGIISLLVPEFHCLDNGENICSTLFAGVVGG